MIIVSKVIKNFLSLITGQVISNIMSFLTTVHIARIFTPQYFGKISFAQIVVGYFMLFTDFGLTKLGIREVAKNPDNLKIVSSTIFIRAILFIISYFFLLITTIFIKKPLIDKYLMLIFGLAMIPSVISIDWFYQGIEKMEYTGIYNALKTTIFFLCITIFIKTKEQILYVPIFFTLGLLIAAIFLFFVYYKNFDKLQFSLNTELLKYLIRHAIPLGFSLLMIQIYYNIDSVMLGFMKTDADVGYYNAGYKLIVVFGSFAGLFYHTLFPLVSKYYSESQEKLKLLIQYSTKFMISLGIPLGIGGVILADKLILFIYGANYLPYSSDVLKILIWAGVIIFLSYGMSLFLIAVNLGKEYAQSVIGGAVFNVIANFFVIPKYGIIGASITTVITELLILCWMLYSFNKKVFTLSFSNFLFKPVIASVIMGMIIFILKNLNLIYSLTVGIIVYFLVFFLIRGFTYEEWKILKNVR